MDLQQGVVYPGVFLIPNFVEGIFSFFSGGAEACNPLFFLIPSPIYIYMYIRIFSLSRSYTSDGSDGEREKKKK